jgi:hypothetical protein
MLDDAELQKLNKGWPVILVIWGAILFSLAVYLVVCYMVEDQLTFITFGPDFPLETFKFILYGISVLTLVAAYHLRKAMLKVRGGRSIFAPTHKQTAPNQHPALGKYVTAMIIALALSESIAIYGLVLFLTFRDWLALYQLITLSAAAMIYFRPRKEEILELAVAMRGNRDSAT